MYIYIHVIICMYIYMYIYIYVCMSLPYLYASVSCLMVTRLLRTMRKVSCLVLQNASATTFYLPFTIIFKALSIPCKDAKARKSCCICAHAIQQQSLLDCVERPVLQNWWVHGASSTIIWMFPKIGVGPQIIHLFIGFWNHYFHHPFWG